MIHVNEGDKMIHVAYIDEKFDKYLETHAECRRRRHSNNVVAALKTSVDVVVYPELCQRTVENVGNDSMLHRYDAVITHIPYDSMNFIHMLTHGLPGIVDPNNLYALSLALLSKMRQALPDPRIIAYTGRNARDVPDAMLHQHGADAVLRRNLDNAAEDAAELERIITSDGSERRTA